MKRINPVSQPAAACMRVTAAKPTPQQKPVAPCVLAAVASHGAHTARLLTPQLAMLTDRRYVHVFTLDLAVADADPEDTELEPIP